MINDIDYVGNGMMYPGLAANTDRSPPPASKCWFCDHHHEMFSLKLLYTNLIEALPSLNEHDAYHTGRSALSLYKP